MPNASYRVLGDMFRQHLNFTPTSADVAAFERDLAVVSPSIMMASLIELSQGKSALPVGVGAWRAAIYAVYNRKVAEHAQLFPMFHCFETAFRSRVAVSLEDHYQTPTWWAAISAEIRRGGTGAAINQIGVVNPVGNEKNRAIRLTVSELTEKSIDVALFQDGYQLLERCTMGQAKRLLEAHWPIMKHFFKNGQIQKSKESVLQKYDLIRAARNSVYHHLSLSSMTTVYETAEELLSDIDFPLPRIHKKISATSCAPPIYF